MCMSARDDPIIHPCLLRHAIEAAETNPNIFLAITQKGGAWPHHMVMPPHRCMHIMPMQGSSTHDMASEPMGRSIVHL